MTETTDTTDKYDALRKRLVVWTAMSETEKKMAGEPTTVVAWCERYGASDRWVSKQRAKDAFKKELAELQAKKLDQNPFKPIPGFSEEAAQKELSNVELFGEVVRNQLVLAAQGDKVALDFIKSANVSKPFVDQLNAEFQTEYPDLTDEELVDRFLDVFADLCADALRTRGWSVERVGQVQPS
jgi:hypothetical protein